MTNRKLFQFSCVCVCGILLLGICFVAFSAMHKPGDAISSPNGQDIIGVGACPGGKLNTAPEDPPASTGQDIIGVGACPGGKLNTAPEDPPASTGQDIIGVGACPGGKLNTAPEDPPAFKNE